MKSKARDYSNVFLASLTAFLGWSLIASLINHIDDADEPFGYWEPLHYLLYRDGLQTWEYAPQYAIRTYAFILPFYLLCLPLKGVLQLPKVAVFYTLRAILGALSAYASSKFVQAVAERIDFRVAVVTLLLMLTAPGVFFASTAFLPSAVAGTLLMLATAAWLQQRFPAAIIFGSIAVLATGWPFVGALFAPMGLHMVFTVLFATPSESESSVGSDAASSSDAADAAARAQKSYVSSVSRRSASVFSWPLLGSASNSTGLWGLLQLVLTGIVIVASILGIVASIDHHYYGKW